MKTIKKYILIVAGIVSVGLLQGCKENIDMSNRYTFTDETIASYLEKHADYSEYYRLLGEVKISKRKESSSVLQLLTARGKYTVFAPTNDAIQEYLDTLSAQGIIPGASWDAITDETVRDSLYKVIVFSSILDGTKDDIEPYQTGGFPEDGEEFGVANMNDRKLRFYYGANPDSMYINGTKDGKEVVGGCLIDLTNRDIYAINGYIHQMRDVIAPSNETLADVLRTYIETNSGDFIVTAKLILAAGLADTLSKVKDEVYENMRLNEDPRVADLAPLGSENNGIISGKLPEHRYYGYTLFAETDDFWRTELGKEPSEITPAEVQAWVISKNYYPDATDNTEYDSEDNVLNQFITYHLLPMRLAAEKLVIHYNEKGYNYKSSTQFTIPTYEIYTTMGKRRLMKLYQAGPRFSLDGDSKIYLNRFPVLANGRHENYAEVSVTPETEGIVVNTTEALDFINCYIYPIDKPLVYDMTTRENFQRQRIRFDVTSMFPELMNNDFRANRVTEVKPGFPIDKNYKYLDDADIEEGTRFYYLSGLNRGWNNWQGDELNISGKYEFTLRIPPVPMAGTYEIRYAVQSNSQLRSMCQVYFGTNKDDLPAQGIPLDLRQAGTYRALASGNVASTLVGWEADQAEDDDYNAEVDKKMRNNGFMKGAANYAYTPGGTNYARDGQTTLRRIIVRAYMYPDKVYYLKFKNVLDDENKQHYMDYLELCAKEVYDNPRTPEDIW